MQTDALFALVVVVVLLYLFQVTYRSYIDKRSVISTVDNHYYVIRHASTKTEQELVESANTLAEINRRIMILIRHLETAEHLKTQENRMFLKMLIQNYNPSIISEAAVDERFTTFMVNKEEMHICLRTRNEQKRIYPVNTLMYVVIHELAHLCNYDDDGVPIIGHGREFKRIFRILVEESIRIGIYDYVNYFNQPVEYCGMTINSTILPS
jgi:hypothetical protein